jgi:hypothetical protein
MFLPYASPLIFSYFFTGLLYYNKKQKSVSVVTVFREVANLLEKTDKELSKSPLLKEITNNDLSSLINI